MSSPAEQTLAPTPSQTIGPFFGFALPLASERFVVPAGTNGAISIVGRLLDGEHQPVADGLIETWQANPEGRFYHPDDPRGPFEGDGFRGFGRSATDGGGRFELLTVKPGCLPGPGDTTQAPHIAVSVFARGLLQRLVTRIYFGDEEEANAADPVLSTLQLGESRRQRLLAAPIDGGYRFDIVLQGPDESAFLSI